MAKTKTKTKTKSKTRIRPLEDRVLVKPSEAQEKTDAGIFLPDSAQEKQQHGKIIAVGPGKLNDDGEHTPMEVKVGEVVVFSQYGGTDVDIDGETHKILRESDLLAVIER
jgi:chaperonin GroES